MSQSSVKQKDSASRVNLHRLVGIITRFAGNSWRSFILAGFMLLFEAGTATLIPLLIAYIIDYLTLRLAQLGGEPVALPLSPLGFLGIRSFNDPDLIAVVFVTLGIILMTMINRLGSSLAEVSLAQGGRWVGYNLRVFLYGHLQKLSLAFHNQSRTGDILARITSDVAAVEDFIVSDLADFVKSGLLILFILVAMVLNAWQVAAVAALMIPLMAIITNYYSHRIRTASQKVYNSEGELASTAQEMLTSIRVVQVYGQGSYEHSLFSDQGRRSMNSALEVAGYEARLNWLVSVLGAVVTAAVIWIGVYLVFRNPLDIGGIGLLAAYVRYIQDMLEPTKKLIEEWSTYGELSASLEGIGELLDLKPSVKDEPGAIKAPPIKGHLEFRNVHFAYPSNAPEREGGGGDVPAPAALKNVQFEIHPGQVVGMVGHTGAGKSTIAQLIPRMYDPNAGQVLIDGHDVREFTLDSLRSQISMVHQQSILFTGSIVENIAYGRPEATGAEIIEAAKEANAHEFISKLPDGYFTLLGERGSNLSDGQRQRISIARAFIRNSPILILDEPSTGLDTESTDLVLHALHKLMKGKTTVIISHDPNLIREVDKVIVVNGGEIEQMGTPEELIQAGGFYANLQKPRGEPRDQPENAQSQVGDRTS